MTKYGVRNNINLWCNGSGIFTTREVVNGSKSFCTTDINFAYQYREDIDKRNGGMYQYWVEEVNA